ncbi:MAG: hypothetical protein IKL01_00320, partial [Mailhella sp.]|nr:hypothetical protein [Mailhella sp.]
GAGIEPARIAPLVFETSASTDSAIRAFGASHAVPVGTAFCDGFRGLCYWRTKPAHRSELKESAWKVDLPVKGAKVDVFSENPKFSYLCKI